MATINPPPRLQIAQVLADLSDLNVAEPEAALALVTAPQHLRISTQKPPRAGSGRTPPSLSTSSSYLLQSQDGRRRSSGVTSTPPPLTPGALSRTLSRNDSAASGASGTGSGVWERYQTPSPGVERDPDLERVSALMQLYEVRGRFKQQDNGVLVRARANVEAVAERYGKWT